MDNPSRLTVGIADMKVSKVGPEIVTHALGSCIGICLMDERAGVAGMVHIMLPLNMEAGRTNPLKYADTGIKETIKAMEAMGASKTRLTAKIAGGAKMFATESSNSSFGNIGARNTESVELVLKKEGIRILAQDTGGTVARTLVFDTKSGKATVRSYGRPDNVI